jgi:hypothetical protein
MGVKSCIIIFFISVVLLFPFFSSVNADENISVEINILGEQAQTRFNRPVIVAGIWHYVKISIEEQTFQTITLKFYSGNTMPSIENQKESNYYEWKYNTNTQEWTDLKEYNGYSYINSSYCQITDNTYSFCVGIKDTFPKIIDYFENWTLDIYTDENEVDSINVIIEKPTIGLSKTHHDTITFRVDPFKKVKVVKNDPDVDEYFIIGNTGNIPVTITIDYGAYNQIFDITNSGSKLSPDNSFNHFATLHAESWRAGVFTVTGDAIGTIPEELIITTASITFETSLAMNAADIEVSVGYSDYKIQAIPGSNIVFQYEESLEMYEGQIRDIKVYISGEGTVELDIWSDEINVAILSISGKDQTGTPLTITTTNSSEYAVTISVEALRENKVGEISYELEIDGKYHTYTTEIAIGAPRQKDVGNINIPASSVLIVIIIIIVVGYMISNQIRHRRR